MLWPSQELKAVQPDETRAGDGKKERADQEDRLDAMGLARVSRQRQRTKRDRREPTEARTGLGEGVHSASPPKGWDERRRRPPKDLWIDA